MISMLTFARLSRWSNYMNELKKNWETTLRLLEPELSGISFETWFLPLKPIRTDESMNRIYLKPSDEMQQSILANRYVSILEEKIKEAFGKKYTVIFDMEDIASTSLIYETNGKNFNEEYYLNPRYKFSSFVVGSNNRYAHGAAVAVAEAPSEAYNPLFIYGGSGLGKTHLMHAIGFYILQNSASLKVLYVSSEMFTNEFINALERRKMTEFKNKYRNIDVLLIDDIQFIEGKEGTQEEFFHTFNSLYELNKQIVISSDRSPSKLTNIEERLRSRFQWNIIADISPPDYETRVAILRKKAHIENMETTAELMDVISLIAEKIKMNIRELEGAFMRVISFSNLFNEKIDLHFARKVLKDVLSASDFAVTPETIKKKVCKHFNIKVSDIESSKRTNNLSFPRQIAMYICRDMTEASLNKIGECFGGRDHTTVLHACEKISREMKENEALRHIISDIEKELNGL